ncbi:MAG TPA: hypothetical protein VF719_04920 [Abditibacteriaceae bacterium]|jgi:hypothetical protein
MNKHILLTVLALGTTVVTSASAQDAKPLSSSLVATRADAPVLFAPRGWRIERQVNGDLNRDRVPDAALVLVDNGAATVGGRPAPRQRALVVLVREGKGFRRVGFNNTLLLGTRDGGVLYSGGITPVNVTIQRGVLHINQENGSRGVLDTTHKFRYDGKFHIMLIGFDSVERDRLTGAARSISTNYSTGVQRTTTIAAESDTITRSRMRVSRKLRRLEEIKGEERYSE